MSGRSSAAIPRPWSVTVTTTARSEHFSAASSMTDPSGKALVLVMSRDEIEQVLDPDVLELQVSAPGLEPRGIQQITDETLQASRLAQRDAQELVAAAV